MNHASIRFLPILLALASLLWSGCAADFASPPRKDARQALAAAVNGRLGLDRLEAAEPFLAGRGERVRLAAIELLGGLKEVPEAAPVLAKQLKDSDPVIRRTAADALSRLASPAARTALFRHGARYPQDRPMVIRALAAAPEQRMALRLRLKGKEAERRWRRTIRDSLRDSRLFTPAAGPARGTVELTLSRPRFTQNVRERTKLRVKCKRYWNGICEEEAPVPYTLYHAQYEVQYIVHARLENARGERLTARDFEVFAFRSAESEVSPGESSDDPETFRKSLPTLREKLDALLFPHLAALEPARYAAPIPQWRGYRAISLANLKSGRVEKDSGGRNGVEIRRRDATPPEIRITDPRKDGRVYPPTAAKTILVQGRVRDPGGVVDVLVNGEEATLDREGRFSRRVYLKIGENPIAVEARDVAQNRARTRIAITRTAQAPARPRTAPAGPFRALVIGNNAYGQLTPLQTAVDDAHALGELLDRHYGFDVEVLTDATRDEIMARLDRLRETMGERDNLLIYYAGHGHLDPDSDRGYWLPLDASPYSRARWLSTSDISDSLKAIRARRIIVIADSCYAGTLTRGMAVAPKATRGAKRSRTVLTSGGLEPVTDRVGGGGDGLSIFARALTDALLENAGRLSGEQLYQMVRDRVALNAAQTPHYGNIRFSGHQLGGDFLFIRSTP